VSDSIPAVIDEACCCNRYSFTPRIPVRTIFEGLGRGCVAVAMSSNAQFVAAVSMGMPQVDEVD